MMRRLVHIGLCVFALLLASCVDPLTQEVKERILELKVFCDEPIETKAGADGTENGEDRYNENKISWVDFFFFKGDNPDPDTQEATLHVFRIAGSTYEQIFHLDVTPALIFDDSGNATVFALANYPSSSEERSAFNNENLPTLQALYNLSVSTDFVGAGQGMNFKQNHFMMSGMQVLQKPDDGVCIGAINLQRYACKMTVAVKVENEVKIPENPQPGEPQVTWTPMLDGMEIYLVDGVKTVSLGGEFDNPADADYFSYSKNRKKFFAEREYDTDPWVPLFPPSGEYYNTYPMYTYPQHWIYGSNEAPEKEPYLKLVLPWTNGSTQKQFYYKIMLPEDSRPAFKRRLARNNWYHIKIDVGFLGAETDNESVEINGSCLVLNWQNKDLVMKQAEIGRARYLAVAYSNPILRNVSSAVIPYYSSHPAVILSGWRVSRPYFGTLEDGKTGPGGGTINVINANTQEKEEVFTTASQLRKLSGQDKWWDETSGSAIVFEHALRDMTADVTASFDYAPYTIELTLAHRDKTDDPEYQRKITIVQYPAIYIDRITNSDSNQIPGGTTQFVPKDNQNGYLPTSTYWGYAFVDGGAYWPDKDEGSGMDWKTNNQWKSSTYNLWKPGERQVRRDPDRNSTADDMFWTLKTTGQKREYQWRTIYYTGGSLDLYRINVTVLSPGLGLVIGDPRSDIIDNLDFEYPAGYDPGTLDENEKKEKKLPKRTGFAEAPALDGSTRSLKYYYPTDETDVTKKMLAPSYRVSSKFCGVEFAANVDFTKEYARYRCAAYQEDGFPAGRWRLPTMAEVEFVSSLSARGVFTTLFNKGADYWSAHGVVKVGEGTVTPQPTATKALLRCVYDVWYWGEDQTEFDTWSKGKYGDDRGEAGAENSNRVRNHFVWGDRPR